MYDVAAVRAHFPALNRGVAYFDGPGGSQVPDVVSEAIAGTLSAGVANRGRVTAAERVADDAVLAARPAMADLLGAEAAGVVFGRSMTALTFDFARTLAAGWAPGRRGRGDPAGPRREHPALGDRRAAAGATVRWADFDPRPGSCRRRTSPPCCPSGPGWSP